MNHRDKLQKFSIRKYTVGTFSTVIATLVFLGAQFNEAKAEEVNASHQQTHLGEVASNQIENNEKAVDNNNKSTEDQQSNVSNDSQSNSQITHKSSVSNQEDSQIKDDKKVTKEEALTDTPNDNLNSKLEKTSSNDKNNHETTSLDTSDSNENEAQKNLETHELKALSNNEPIVHAQNINQESEPLKNKSQLPSTRVEASKEEIETRKERIDKNKLQAFFDSAYHDYRMIDRDKADQNAFNKIKAAFDKVNNLLGESRPNQEQLDLGYEELKQAVTEAKRLPQRQIKTTNKRVGRGEDRSGSSDTFNGALTEYYVSREGDGSGMPPGTFLHASVKNSPWRYATSGYTIVHASDVESIVNVGVAREKHGYRWAITFNPGHNNNEQMIFWFGIPQGQTPVGTASLSYISTDGNITSSVGTGASAGRPLNEMWNSLSSVNPSSANEFKQGSAQNYNFYSDATMNIRSFHEFARGREGDKATYFNRGGASDEAKRHGDENYKWLNGQDPSVIAGLDKIYAFRGQGNKAYKIEFRTSGDTTDRFYYAAGGLSSEYHSLWNYNNLYVETTRSYIDRVSKVTDTKDRTYHLGNVEMVKNADGVYVCNHLLDGTHSIKEYAEDPESFVVNPTSKITGFVDPDTDRGQRYVGVQEYNSVQARSQFSDDILEEHARTGQPIRVGILFDVQDDSGNPETVKEAKLYVKPALNQRIALFNDDKSNEQDSNAVSKQSGHAVYEFMTGQLHNTYHNNQHNQEIRIRFQSNEPIQDNQWSVIGIPNGLTLEPAAGRLNVDTEKNYALTGNLAPGDYFVTVRFGKAEKQFEIRSKPNAPTISTTEAQLRGKGGTKPPITITGIPADYRARVLLVTGGQDGGQHNYDMASVNPSGYTVLAEAHSNEHGEVTLATDDYKANLPLQGQIKAIVYYTDKVLSNFSNSVMVSYDVEAPQINEPAGLSHKFYRGDQVTITLPVRDNENGTGVKSVNVTLPPGWTKTLEINPHNNREATLKLIGSINRNVQYNTTYHFNITATDNAGNTTSPAKDFIVNVGKLSDDTTPLGLSESERKKVVNPNSLTPQEKNEVINALKAKNQSISGTLYASDPFAVGDNGEVTVLYRDGSNDTIPATSVITYEPQRKAEFTEPGNNNKKEAFITIAKGQEYQIGTDLRRYFALSNGSNIPTDTSFTAINASNLPSPQEMSRKNVGTYTYTFHALNAYHKTSEDLTLKVKVVDVGQPEGNNRIFRTTTASLTSEEVAQVKQAFKNANPSLNLNDNDITVDNVQSTNQVSQVTVTVHKGELRKQFVSNLQNMNFLRWINIRDDYNISWSKDRIDGRNTDGGFEWTPDHKSIIYRYDSTSGRSIDLNQVLRLLKATTTNSKLRNNLNGNEKFLAEEGGRPTYKTTGYSVTAIKDDGQQDYTLDGHYIQVLDLVQPTTGFGGVSVDHTNRQYTSSNSSVVNGQMPAKNGAP